MGISENPAIPVIQYLYFVSYILKLDLREMLNFECRDDDCYIYINHNNTKMPEAGIHYKDAMKYIMNSQQNATDNETIATQVYNVFNP